MVAAIEGSDMTGEEGPHPPQGGEMPGADQEVDVVRQEDPGVYGEGASFRQHRHATDIPWAETAVLSRRAR